MPTAHAPVVARQPDGAATIVHRPPSTPAPARTATVDIDGQPVAVTVAEDGSVTEPVDVADVRLTRASIEDGEGWLEGPVDAPFVSGTARFEVTAGALTGRVQVVAGVDVLGSLVARIGYDGPANTAVPMPEVAVDAGRVNLNFTGRLEDGGLVVEPVAESGLLVSPDDAAPPAPGEDGDQIAVATPPPDISPGTPLPPALTEKLALLLGQPPDGLFLHTDAAAADAVRAIDASGLVAGSDLYAPPEAADPEIPSGLDLLVRMVTQALAGLDGPALPADELSDPTTQAVEAQPPVAFEPPGPMGEPAPDVAPAAGPATPAPDEEVVPAEGAAPAPEEEGEATAALGTAAEGEEGEEPPEIQLLIPPAPAEPPPEQQERIQGVSRRAGGRARSARDLPPADSLTTDAREGVTEPPAETMGRAEAAIAEVLGERAPPSPAIVDLCAEIRTAIREKRPVDEDDLVKADPEEMAEEAGQSLNTAVEGEAEQVDTSYDAIDEVEPGEPAQTGEPIPEQSPEVRGPQIGATAAAPDPIPPEDISLDADRQQLDTQVEESNINRPSTEPITDEPFATVRQGQEEFNELAETSPAEVIAEQDAALEQASADMAALQLQAMQTLQQSRRRTVGDVEERQAGMVGDEQVTRESLSRQANEIFSTTQTQVNALLNPLTQTAMEKWNRGVDRASTTFKKTLSRVERWIDERHSGVGGFFVSGWDAAFGLPDWVTDSYDRAERLFGDDVCDLLLEISSDVNAVITSAEELIADARRRIDDLFTQEMPDELKEWAAQQQAQFNQQLDGLNNQVTEARQDFEQQISEAAVSSVREVQEEVEALRQAARGLLGQVMDAIGDFLDDPVRAIINGLLSLVGIPPPAFWALVDKVAQVASDIADDPMNFVNNLISAIGQGFQLFFDHIGDHLLQGLFDWLFAGLGSVGVQIPAGTSVGELVTFALQLMGITWPNIREILVRHIGEENVELIEQAWELVSMLIEQGPEGIIEMLRERLAPEAIFQMVLDAAIDYVVETLIEQAARWLFSLLSPAGWVTKAIELIYQVLRWVFENAARIFRFVETIVNGLADIVAGNIGGMAAAVEQALASLIPVVIDFLAGLVGLGDLPDQVVEVIKAIQTRVLGVLDAIIGWLVERARGLLEALGLGGEDEEEEEGGDEDTELGSTERFVAGGESHRQWVEVIGDAATLMVASSPETLEQRLDRWDSEVDDLPDEARAEASGLLPQARSLHEQADTAADDLAPAFAEAQAAPAPAEGETAPDVPSDAPLESKQEQLKGVLRRLFELFDEVPPFEAIEERATWPQGSARVDATPEGDEVALQIDNEDAAGLVGRIAASHLSDTELGEPREALRRLDGVRDAATSVAAFRIGERGELQGADPEEVMELVRSVVAAVVGFGGELGVPDLQRTMRRDGTQEFVVLFNLPDSPNTEYEQGFETEFRRQLAEQQTGMNRLALDRWFINRALYTAGQKELAHLDSVGRAAVFRIWRERAEGMADRARTRKQDLLSAVSTIDALIAALEASDATLRPPDMPQIATNELRHLNVARRFGTEKAWRKKNLNAITQGQDPPTSAEWLRRQLRARGDYWGEQATSTSRLVVLHNPDQIAGGEGEIDAVLPEIPPATAPPAEVEAVMAEIMRVVGSKQVNESLGAQWKTQINELSDQVVAAAYPRPAWPLWILTVRLDVG